MSVLDDILAITDDTRRQQELVNYAHSLRINTIKAKKTDGSCDEDYLTVLIFDAIKSKQAVWYTNIGLIIGAMFIMGMILTAIFLFIRFSSGGADTP